MSVAELSTFASYMMLVVAPVASTLLRCAGFRRSSPGAVNALRAGSWIGVSRSDAEAHPLYGANGAMVSLLVRMMRTRRCVLPSIRRRCRRCRSRRRPDCRRSIFAMTSDAVALSSLYMIVFVAALRRAPLLPRLLAATGVCDVSMQLGTVKPGSAIWQCPACCC